MTSDMDCKNCGETLWPEREQAILSIFDRYQVAIGYPTLGGSGKATLYPLFSKLIEDIRNGDEAAKYRTFDFFITDQVEAKCPHCGTINAIRFQLSVQDEFFLYIEKTIDFEIDNLLLKYTGASANDLRIDTLSLYEIQAFLDELPSEFEHTRSFIVRLFETKNMLPIHGGRGGGPEILDWIVQQVSAQLVGVIVTFAFTSGIDAVRRQIRNIDLRKRIRRRIAEKSGYWDDVSFDELERHLNVPKDYKGSKEELIEDIIVSKLDSYKRALVEKLRYR